MTHGAGSTDHKRRACVIRYQPFSDPDGRREAEALARAGMDVTLVCLGRDGEPALERHGCLQVRRFRLPKQRGGVAAYVVDYGLWFAVCFLWITWNHLRRPFSVVQVSSLPDFQIFTAAIPKLTGATVVLFLKEPAAELVEATDGPRLLAKLMRHVSKAAIRFADLTFTVTNEHKALYVRSGVESADLAVIENTPPPEYLEVSRSERRETDRFVAICHGTIEARYGHDTIVDAAAILRDRGVPMSIVITGGGTWSQELERRIADQQLSDMISYRGFVPVDELSDLLAEASVGIVAQHRSSYSDVVHTQKMYEFMALGIPVVASRLRSTSNYFSDAIEFFEPGDAGELADALEQLWSNEGRRAHLVVEADRKYEALSWPTLERRFVEAIASVSPDLVALPG